MRQIMITSFPGPWAAECTQVASAIGKSLEAAGVGDVTVWQAASPEALEKALANRDTWHLVLSDTGLSVAERALRGAASTGEALAQWQAHSRAVLQIYRRHRRQMNFALLQSARKQPGPFWQALCAALGVAARDVGFAAALPDAGTEAAWPGVLATQAVRQDSETQRLSGELAAGAIFAEGPQADVARARAEIAALEEDRRAARDERDRLRDRICQMETAHHAALRSQHNELTSRLSAEATCLQETAQAERALLIRQLDDVKSELRALFVAQQAAKQEADQTAAEMSAALQAQHARMQAQEEERMLFLSSTSWRFTAPLRFVKQTLSSPSRRKE